MPRSSAPWTFVLFPGSRVPMSSGNIHLYLIVCGSYARIIDAEDNCTSLIAGRVTLWATCRSYACCMINCMHMSYSERSIMALGG